MRHKFSPLLKRLACRRAEAQRRTSFQRNLRQHGIDHEYGGLYPPVARETIEAAERTLGFRLPPLLREIYEGLANGGFGPGSGLVGLAGGYTFEDLGDLPLVEHHLTMTSESDDFPWPAQLLNVCDIGCGGTYAVDCSAPDYPVFETWGGQPEQRVSTFVEMMKKWADGTGESAYR